MTRPRIVDAEKTARRYREVFAARPVKNSKELPFTWPLRLRHVGTNLAVAYASDKWKLPGDYTLYKHLAESPNRALCTEDFLVDHDSAKPVTSRGPIVDFTGVPMPKQFAVLGTLDEVDLDLDGDVVRVTVPHGMLGASKIRWSVVDPQRKDEPFLLVYTEPRAGHRGGVGMIIVGEELDVERDGIVG